MCLVFSFKCSFSYVFKFSLHFKVVFTFLSFGSSKAEGSCVGQGMKSDLAQFKTCQKHRTKKRCLAVAAFSCSKIEGWIDYRGGNGLWHCLSLKAGWFFRLIRGLSLPHVQSDWWIVQQLGVCIKSTQISHFKMSSSMTVKRKLHDCHHVFIAWLGLKVWSRDSLQMFWRVIKIGERRRWFK